MCVKCLQKTCDIVKIQKILAIIKISSNLVHREGEFLLRGARLRFPSPLWGVGNNFGGPPLLPSFELLLRA